MSRRGKGLYFFFTVDDVDEFYHFVVAGGVKTFDPPEDAGWGGRYFAAVDPNGYRLFFVKWLSGEPGLAGEGEGGGLGLAD
jgi:predicted enzyme related to lactoylglutathione lyase